MRYFVTGASSWIGSAAVRELIAAGHQVSGLARSEDAARAVAAAGAEVVRGDLDDFDVLGAAAADSDGVVHLAFKHDVAFTGGFLAATQADRRAIDCFGAALERSGRPLVIASGALGLAPGRVGTERDVADPAANPRVANTHATLALAERGVRSAVIRFAPTVHGQGDRGFVATLMDTARETGVAGYLGDGGNRWPAVHRADAAALVRLTVDNAPAGAVLHAVAEEGIATRSIAEAISSQLGVPTSSIAPEDASRQFRFLADFWGADAPASNALTRQLLGWEPTGPTLLEDIEAGHYN